MVNRTKIRIIAIVVTVLVVIAAVICLLPWPTRILVTWNCAEVTPEGEILQEFSMTAQGWSYHYLFLDDKMDLNIRTDPETALSIIKPTNAYELTDMHPAEDIYLPCIPLTMWDTLTDEMDFFLMSTTEDFQSCAIVGLTCDTLYVGSVDEDFDPKSLLEQYAQLIRSYG